MHYRGLVPPPNIYIFGGGGFIYIYIYSLIETWIHMFLEDSAWQKTENLELPLFFLLGTLSMLECNIFPGLPQSYLDTEVNLFLLPFMDSETDDLLPRASESREFTSQPFLRSEYKAPLLPSSRPVPLQIKHPDRANVQNISRVKTS